MTRMSGKTPKPWVKLWREERGSFAQLPLFARSLAGEMLKLCDDTGAIELGGREPPEAVAFALGADRSDRRLLRKYMPMLEADGYYRRDGDRLIVVSFREWQEHGSRTEPTAKEPRRDHDGATTEQRPNHEATTTEPRPNHEGVPKYPESHDRKSQELEEELELEKEPPCSPPEGDRQTRADYAFEQGSELCRIFAERFRTEKPRTAPPRTLQQPDHPVWQKLGLAVWDQAEAEGAERHVVLGRAIARFFGDDWAARSGFPPNALLNAWAKWSSPDSDLDDRAVADDWQARWDALQEEHSDALTRGGPIAAKALEPRFEALRRERRERLSA